MSLAGRLLVATPLLVDPNFWRSVVLILHHDEAGAVGVVLNRPTLERVSDHLEGMPAPDGMVHFGGPVEPQMAIALTTDVNGEPTALPGVRLANVIEQGETMAADVRIYAGYSGWGAGQLEAEVSEGSWYVVDASPDDPFEDPEGQWSRVLRRQRNRLALVSTFPLDPSAN